MSVHAETKYNPIATYFLMRHDYRKQVPFYNDSWNIYLLHQGAIVAIITRDLELASSKCRLITNCTPHRHHQKRAETAGDGWFGGK